MDFRLLRDNLINSIGSTNWIPEITVPKESTTNPMECRESGKELIEGVVSIDGGDDRCYADAQRREQGGVQEPPIPEIAR